jgi:hypothetical protein
LVFQVVLVEIAASVGRVDIIAGGVKDRCARPCGAALDTAGFGDPGDRRKRAEAKRLESHRPEHRGAAPDPGALSGPSR